MWSELSGLQQLLRQVYELPCLSGHRRADGAVCPACRLNSQAHWFEERHLADTALDTLLDKGVRRSSTGWRPWQQSRITADGARFVIATVLTSEDLFRGIGFDGQGRGTEDMEAQHELAEGRAVVLSYVDAVRTLAFSARRAAAAAGEPQRPFVVLLSLRPNEALPQEAQEALEALEEQGLLSLLHLPPPPPHLWPRAWGKLQLWRPRGHELVLYLDADTLVLGGLEPLFNGAAAAGPDLSFAAAVTRSMMGLNAGVMLLRPDMRIYHSLQESLESLPSWRGISRWTGQPWWREPTSRQSENNSAAEKPASNSASFGSSGDQDHLNEWVATHFDFSGRWRAHGKLRCFTGVACAVQGRAC